jgi:hypothetical protein
MSTELIAFAITPVSLFYSSSSPFISVSSVLVCLRRLPPQALRLMLLLLRPKPLPLMPLLPLKPLPPPNLDSDRLHKPTPTIYVTFSFRFPLSLLRFIFFSAFFFLDVICLFWLIYYSNSIFNKLLRQFKVYHHQCTRRFHQLAIGEA